MAGHRYTNEQKAQALILLAANRGNLSLTSSQTGIAPSALKTWVRNEQRLPSPDIGKGMEHAIHYIMGQIPNLVNKYNIAELLGVLLEKYLHYQGIPQNSTQTILAVLATKSEGQLDQMIQDIDAGKKIALNQQHQLMGVDTIFEQMGLAGLAEKGVPVEIAGPRITPDTPTDVIDLIQYTDGPSTGPQSSESTGGPGGYDDTD